MGQRRRLQGRNFPAGRLRFARPGFAGIAAIVAALVSEASIAGGGLPPLVWPVQDFQSTGTRVQPVTGVKLGSFLVVLEQTTLEETIKALGPAKIDQHGDAGDFEAWICYTLPALKARLWLTSGEMGGGEYINGFVMAALKNSQANDARCPVPATEVASATIDNGISLGTSAQVVRNSLGAPKEVPGSVSYYLYTKRNGDGEIDSMLALRLRDKVVTELYASHVSTE